MSILGEMLWKSISAERLTDLESGEVGSIEVVEKHRIWGTLRISKAYPKESNE